MESAKFDRLEEKVNNLLKAFESLEAETLTIREQLKTHELKVKELKESIARFEKEKGLVKEKVEGIITRLDGLLQGA